MNGHENPFAVTRKYLFSALKRYIDDKTRDIRHQDVIADLVRRTDLSGSYLSSLVLANLIALLGLLTNSVAVVIGAMLISPLMGPIFSLGLAFTMGDLVLSRRAVRNITFSVVLTVLVAALFTLISPLKGATHEILSRTRPNIYDLLIATFAGIAGALALCTRTNYLFITAGVAVATAVIPPLSVVGYGIGAWQPGIAAGGFLLFFTNLVAIVISSDLVFNLCRFRGNMATETVYPARRRFLILGVVLAVISIPLVTTLITDIRRVNLTKQVEGILKARLDIKQKTRLTSVSISNDKTLTVTASINTVKYVDSDTLKSIEKELTSRLGKPSTLGLEQVIVRSGAVELSPQVPVIKPPPPPPPLPETLAVLREKILHQLKESCREIESYIAPFKLADSSITFSGQGSPITVHLAISRDFPFTSQEQRWLKMILEKQLGETIELNIEMTPLVPPLGFTGKDELDETSRKALEQLKPIIAQLPAYRLVVVPPAGERRNAAVIRRRISRLKEYLTKELSIPGAFIMVTRGEGKQIQIRVGQ